jgi:hypothetical protein
MVNETWNRPSALTDTFEAAKRPATLIVTTEQPEVPQKPLP